MVLVVASQKSTSPVNAQGTVATITPLGQNPNPVAPGQTTTLTFRLTNNSNTTTNFTISIQNLSTTNFQIVSPGTVFVPIGTSFDFTVQILVLQGTAGGSYQGIINATAGTAFSSFFTVAVSGPTATASP